MVNLRILMVPIVIAAIVAVAIAVPLYGPSDDNRDNTQTSTQTKTNSSTTSTLTNSTSTTTTIRESPDNKTESDNNLQSINLTKLSHFALSLINNHRSDAQVKPVDLGGIPTAQDHAEDLASMCVISHWDSGGMKPYMRYSLAGGEGVVSENVAIQWWQGPIIFTESIIMEAIEDLEYNMMYDDADSNWGHRDNIINPVHNIVHIGIALGSNCIIYVEHFEDDYLDWTNYPSLDDSNELRLSGVITVSSSTLSSQASNSNKAIRVEDDPILSILIAFDPLPELMTAQELESSPNFYQLGDWVGTVLEPLPPGWYYPDLNDTDIVGSEWSVSIQGNNTFFDITANIRPIIEAYGRGVYTITLWSTYYSPHVQVIQISFFVVK